MITRIEIDGFKSFEDFALDLRPFTAVIGTNAGGKSNLVEALLFLSRLSRLSTDDLHEAVDAVRGRTLMLLRQRGDGSRVERMRFAVELLLDLRPADVLKGRRDSPRVRQVVEDPARRELWVESTARDQPPFPADPASDVTPRALALPASIHDPRHWSGPLVVEEPENGLLPERLRDLSTAVRAATSDPATDGGPTTSSAPSTTRPSTSSSTTTTRLRRPSANGC